MTQLLERAIRELQKLPGPAQDAIATLILEQIADDRAWDDSFAGSQDQLARLAQKVREDVDAEKRIPLSEVKDDLSRYLRLAETEEVVITRHGKPAGVLIGFKSEEDWFEYRLENDQTFQRRIEAARRSPKGGQGIRLEDTDE